MYVTLYNGIPWFMKVHFISLHVYKVSTLVIVLPNWEKCQENFNFYEKGQKIKIVFIHYRGASTSISKSINVKILPQDP